MIAGLAVRRPRLAASGCKRCATGCSPSSGRTGRSHRPHGAAPGKPPLLSDAQQQALARIVETGPIPAAHGVVRWRLVDLIQGVFDAFGLSISKQTLSRELRALGFRKLSARPRHHAQDADAPAAFKKTSPPTWRLSRA